MFTTINSFKNKNNRILLQGDSWAEQLTNVDRKKYYLANNFVKKFSVKENIGFINAGITSYSPTLMKLQYKILNKDFNINPNIVIAIIDQTDIADENCRYKDKKVLKGNEVIAVNKDFLSDRPLDFTYLYKMSEINVTNTNKFLKTYHVTNSFIIHKLKVFTKKNFIKLSYFLKNKEKFKYKKCHWEDIAKYLESGNEEEISYFKLALKDYIDYILESKNIEKFYLVTFPHKNNLTEFLENNSKKYKHNVSSIVDSLNVKNSKFKHINFTKMIENNNLKINENSFQKNDPASHLADVFYAEVFMNKIINSIRKDLR